MLIFAFSCFLPWIWFCLDLRFKGEPFACLGRLGLQTESFQLGHSQNLLIIVGYIVGYTPTTAWLGMVHLPIIQYLK
jgi:hypothetical protein